MQIVTFLFLAFITAYSYGQDIVYNVAGNIYFKSDAPLELIEARSSELKGLVDFSKNTFAFSVPIVSFKGFNSSLQREHFNENYMESEKYPRASFSGRIIEDVDLSNDGEHVIRAKGKLLIHGVEQERIIRATISVKEKAVTITSNFTVLLQDHNIAIPKVVQQKIAEEIFVEINASGQQK